MDKNEVLAAVKELASQGMLSQEELLGSYQQGGGAMPAVSTVAPVNSLTKSLNVADILYYVGGLIVFLGIAILIFQHWETLGVPTRILSTLGSGIVAYWVGLLFSRSEKTTNVAVAFFLISALVLPIGLAVTFYSANVDISSMGFQVELSAILLGVYLLSRLIFRQTVFTLFSIVYGTWLYYALTNFLISGPALGDWQFVAYRTLLAGLVYILFGYWFDQHQDSESVLSGFLYGFGILGFLGAAMALGGWFPAQNISWEIIFPGLALATVFLSVQLKSRSFLIFGTLFLMGYILKITAEYFTEGLGWSLSLVVAGLALIAVGYLSFRLNQKYLKAA